MAADYPLLKRIKRDGVFSIDLRRSYFFVTEHGSNFNYVRLTREELMALGQEIVRMAQEPENVG